MSALRRKLVNQTILMNRRQRQIYWLKVDRRKRRFERKYITEMGKALDLQVEPILEAAQLTGMENLADRVNNLVKTEPIQNSFFALYEEVGSWFSKQTITNLKKIKGLVTKEERTLVDDPENYQSLWLSAIRDYVLTEAGGRIVTITDTSRREALKIINEITEQAIAEGIGVNEASRLLQDRFPVEWRKRLWRAELIARTEVNTAANRGASIGAEATGLPLRKMWVAAADGRERPSHRFADGQVRLKGQPFDVGGVPMQEPGAAGAPAEEVCNCRCSVAYISERLAGR